MRQAKKTGARHKGGKVLRVTIYPRARTKSIIVEEARLAKVSVSNFVLLGILKEIAARRNVSLDELIPEDELETLKAIAGWRNK